MELSIPVPVPELPNVIPAHPWPIVDAVADVKILFFDIIVTSHSLATA